MTALHALRLAASEQPEGALKSLLNWAELHIGDQFERICELEDENGVPFSVALRVIVGRVEV